MIISIASGKGGTGKTLVATSLALSLNDRDNVQLLDCDVEEPNDHLFLKPAFTRSKTVSIPIPKVDEEKCTYCGKCAEACPSGNITLVKSISGILHKIDRKKCKGRGECAKACPNDALKLVGYAKNAEDIFSIILEDYLFSQINLEAVIGEPCLVLYPVQLGTTEDSLHPGGKLLHPHWFGAVVIGALVQ